MEVRQSRARVLIRSLILLILQAAEEVLRINGRITCTPIIRTAPAAQVPLQIITWAHIRPKQSLSPSHGVSPPICILNSLSRSPLRLFNRRHISDRGCGTSLAEIRLADWLPSEVNCFGILILLLATARAVCCWCGDKMTYSKLETGRCWILDSLGCSHFGV